MKPKKTKTAVTSGGQAYITVGADAQAANMDIEIVCSSGTLMFKERQGYGGCTTPFKPSKKN